jgi:hypothetical protein
MDFWPPVSFRDWALLLITVFGGLYLLYVVARLITFGVFKSIFEARRDHYKKLKGDIESWRKDSQGK